MDATCARKTGIELRAVPAEVAPAKSKSDPVKKSTIQVVLDAATLFMRSAASMVLVASKVSRKVFLTLEEMVRRPASFRKVPKVVVTSSDTMVSSSW